MSKMRDKIIGEKLKEAGVDTLEKADMLMDGMLSRLSDRKLIKAYDIFKKKYEKQPSDENEHILKFCKKKLEERGLHV